MHQPTYTDSAPGSLERLLTDLPHHVLFSCVAGSRAYGTQNHESDEDVRGIYAVPARDYVSLHPPLPQVADERGNTVFFSLRRLIELLAVANPNVLELLFMPEDCVRERTPEMDSVIAARDIFITRQCGDTHIGYAMSQIKKARGQNKWVNDPKPAQAPLREAFCFIIPRARLQQAEGVPCRPIPLAQTQWDLRHFHAARLEHASNTYRLYDYGTNGRGVFRGDELVCESIPEQDEGPRFAGLLLFNEQSWRQSLADHQNYWRWRRDRNDSRWRQQEAGEVDFDSKNMLHTVRLLLSGKSILQRGVPLVRMSGPQLQLLLDIRAGRLTFGQIMQIADAIVGECETLKNRSDLPAACDPNRANRLLMDVTRQWECRFSK